MKGAAIRSISLAGSHEGLSLCATHRASPAASHTRAASKSSDGTSPPPLYAEARAVAIWTYDLPSVSTCGVAKPTALVPS